MVTRKQKIIDNQELEQTRQKLLNQLRNYPQEEQAYGVPNLSEDSRKLLSKNWMETIQSGETQLTKHREAFINFVIDLLKDEKNYLVDGGLHGFNEIFGEKGLELYQKALQEEVNDIRYKEACFNAATHFVEGERWEQPAAVVISGPSGCGKSHATSRVLETLHDLPKARDEENNPINEGNVLVSLDGGIYRQVSQMRKLAIRISNYLEHPGIKDLHDKSRAIEPIKDLFKDILLAEPELGIIMPETYSTWINPFSKHKDLIEKLCNGRTFIFGQVVGTHQLFSDVVKFMGESRAWKTDDKEVIIDLNDPRDLKESKAYGETGFHFGKIGSQNALAFYSAKFGDKALIIKIPNDLILLQQNQETGAWEPAKSKDKNILLISATVYQEWINHGKSGDLKEFAKHCNMQPELELSDALNALLRQEKEEELTMGEKNEQSETTTPKENKSTAEITTYYRRNVMAFHESEVEVENPLFQFGDKL